jgi:hypothetical protein
MRAVVRTVNENRRWKAEPKIQRGLELWLCTAFDPHKVDLAPVLLCHGLEQFVLRLASRCHIVKNVWQKGDEAHVFSPAGAVKRSLGYNLFNAKRYFSRNPLRSRPRVSPRVHQASGMRVKGGI